MHRTVSINGSFEGPFSDYDETSKCSVDITMGLMMRNFDWCDGAQSESLGNTRVSVFTAGTTVILAWRGAIASHLSAVQEGEGAIKRGNRRPAFVILMILRYGVEVTTIIYSRYH